LGKAITALTNFKVDPAIAVPTWKVVFLDEFFWDIGELNANVFRIWHWSVEIEFFILMVLNRAPFLERTLLRSSLTSLSKAVLVPMSPG
jgi:hypothetical protein